MSTNGRWWFLDLVLALMLTVVGGIVAYAELGGRLRVALVLPLVVFLPGYVLISAVFPEGEEDENRTFGSGNDDAAYAVGGPERIALAVALSVAIVPMIAALSNFTPWGVRVHPILYGIVGFTVIFAAIAFVRRLRVPAERRYSPGVPEVLFNPSGRSGGGLTVALNVGIVISFVLLASTVGFAVLNPPQGETFTEFYVNTNDVNGQTNTMYNTNLAEDGVTVNVHSYERERTEYTVVAVIERVEGGSVTDRSQFAKEQVTVDAGEKKQVKLTGDPAFTGDNVRVRLRLYKGSASGEPYITTRAWVSPGSAPTNQASSADENRGTDSGENSDDGGDSAGEGDDGGDSGQETTEQQQTTQQRTTEQQQTTQQQTSRQTTQRRTTQRQTTTSSQSTPTTTTTTAAGTTSTATTTTTTEDDGGLFS
ncbi:DUF1616 domain-containing protein [Haladaptatus sp. DYF46]|uniref:DUF1616 domain-containing protein n=1 Tax=Haladaptatus sp. DYF46 TaxID=2886041 RepID=UPI001E3C18B4|nr:DUF1616 domain-containing protein [Haladaptatus sp. DYF46]